MTLENHHFQEEMHLQIVDFSVFLLITESHELGNPAP